MPGQAVGKAGAWRGAFTWGPVPPQSAPDALGVLQATQLDTAFIRRDPYGVVLIITPCNYPIYHLVVPLVGAIAAGQAEPIPCLQDAGAGDPGAGCQRIRL